MTGRGRIERNFISVKLSETEWRIAVISDTHWLLRPEVTEKMRECELILHAGDIYPGIDVQGRLDRVFGKNALNRRLCRLWKSFFSYMR